MTPALTVFIDSLKPESVECMDFLSSFENKARVKTELPSYSNTCHASMYTGVYPNKHLHEFIWYYSPETSCFNPLKKLGLHWAFKDKYTKFICFEALSMLNFKTSPYGYFFFQRYPLDYWTNFNFAAVKFWGKPDSFVGGYTTVFEILRRNKIRYDVYWSTKGPLKKINNRSYLNPWTYYFIGHMDTYSHFYGQESPKAREFLAIVDKRLENLYSAYKKLYGEDFTFFAFSDHGQTKIEERVDLHVFFASKGGNLNDYLHIIDSCYARFWFRNDKEREEVGRILQKMNDKGFILTEEIMKKYHAEIPDNRYGDLIFYLDKPCIFDVVNPNAISMHGYLPDHSDSDGIFISNKKIVNLPYIKLEDIAPSLLSIFGIERPKNMDGNVIWK